MGAALGTAGAPAAEGGPQDFGGMGGDGTTRSGIMSAPEGGEAAPRRTDDVPASERGNPDELAGRDDDRREPGPA